MSLNISLPTDLGKPAQTKENNIKMNGVYSHLYQIFECSLRKESIVQLSATFIKNYCTIK